MFVLIDLRPRTSVFQVCPNCAGDKEYVRLFDVTERTGVRKHATGRHCHCCQSELKDTIVHFGEKVCVAETVKYVPSVTANKFCYALLWF